MKRADPKPIINVVSNHNMDDALDEELTTRLRIKFPQMMYACLYDGIDIEVIRCISDASNEDDEEG